MTGAATSIVRLVFPDQTNHHGTFFGGELMRLLDAIAFIAATRYLRLPSSQPDPNRSTSTRL